METRSAQNTEYMQWAGFKSYYVVWKLFFKQNGHGKGHGLNRTMQYGNLNGPAKYFESEGGLNRTMQYGNLGVGILSKNPIIV